MSQLNILVIDDAPFLRLMFIGFPATMSFARNRVEAEKQLALTMFDAILMDGELEGWDGTTHGHGPDIVRKLRAKGLTTKIVMFSAREDINEEGLAAGADASWRKGNLDEKNWMPRLLKVLT